jgi:hypothetical protein
LKITAEPRSDQINYEDFLSGPKVYTIGGVRAGTAEQKYDIQLQEEQRVWRPPLTVLRTLIACWGDDATAWHGRQVELFGDPSIRFGKEAVGGIRIKALSHLDEPKTVSVTVARGKRQKITVQPLQVQQQPTQPAQGAPSDADWYAAIEEAAGDADALRTLWQTASKANASQQVLQAIQAAAQGEQQ